MGFFKGDLLMFAQRKTPKNRWVFIQSSWGRWFIFNSCLYFRITCSLREPVSSEKSTDVCGTAWNAVVVIHGRRNIVVPDIFSDRGRNQACQRIFEPSLCIAKFKGLQINHRQPSSQCDGVAWGLAVWNYKGMYGSFSFIKKVWTLSICNPK